jgi:hypothetical protein
VQVDGHPARIGVLDEVFETPKFAACDDGGANDVFVPGLIAGTPAGSVLLACAFAEPIMPNWAPATVMAAAPKKRRRLWLISPACSAIARLENGKWIEADAARGSHGWPHVGYQGQISRVH